jgi:malonyl-CoA/methylmalonyl-CoA synthetase
VIRDLNLHCEKTLLEVLTDALALRRALREKIDSVALEAIDRGEERYVAILAGGGYEYTVAILAVLALGAAAVPMTTVLPVDEATYFVHKSKAVAVLAQSSAINLAQDLEKAIMQSTDSDFRMIPIKPSIFNPPNHNMMLSSNKYPDGNSSGVVIFTSGTTGPPKGSVMRLAYVYDGAMSVAEHYQLEESDVMLHVLPVHHATGIGVTFFPFLISGATIEFKSGGFDEVWMWNRWREGVLDPNKRLTFFSGVPTIYMRMKRYYQQTLSKLPANELASYIAGARQFKGCLCGTSALARPINEFWTALMQKSILQRYGATEFGAVFKVQMGDKNVPDGSVGKRMPGIDVKLSDGEEGEVLVKSPVSKILLGNASSTKQRNLVHVRKVYLGSRSNGEST